MEYVQAEISHEARIHKFMEKKLQLITEFPREPKLHFVEEITGNFANEREIGKGSFGVVYKVYLIAITINLRKNMGEAI